MNYNIADLYIARCYDLGMTTAEARRSLDMFYDVLDDVIDLAYEGHNIRVRGIGKFTSKIYKAREVDGFDGKRHAIPERRVVRFELSDKVKRFGRL